MLRGMAGGGGMFAADVAAGGMAPGATGPGGGGSWALAAVAKAVRAATGVRYHSLPLSPPNILAGLTAQAAE